MFFESADVEYPIEEAKKDAYLLVREATREHWLEIYLAPMTKSKHIIQPYTLIRSYDFPTCPSRKVTKIFIKRSIIGVCRLRPRQFEITFIELLLRKNSWVRHWCKEIAKDPKFRYNKKMLKAYLINSLPRVYKEELIR